MKSHQPGASQRRRFNWHRLGNAALGRLGRIGIKLHPFLVVREDGIQLNADDVSAGFDFGFIDSAALPEILRLQPDKNEAAIRARFSAGNLCFGAKEGSRLVGTLWCDLAEFNFPLHRRPLAPDEAYFFDAYVDPSCRGRHLAPSMRIRCCVVLAEMGRTRYWSYTDYFNLSARRFKRTLGAEDDALRLHADLFGWISGTWTLRKYPSGQG